ncbi:MAG: hypothetical protein AcusKO_07270 [Acuticoccus sp.]
MRAASRRARPEQAAADREARSRRTRSLPKIAEREAAEAAEREEAEASATAEEGRSEAGETADGRATAHRRTPTTHRQTMDMAEVAPETSDDIGRDTERPRSFRRPRRPANHSCPARDGRRGNTPAPDADEEPPRQGARDAFAPMRKARKRTRATRFAFIAAEPDRKRDIIKSITQHTNTHITPALRRRRRAARKRTRPLTWEATDARADRNRRS